MEVAPGIFQFKIPIPDNPLGNLLAYLVKGDGRYMMVDTGWPNQESLVAWERQLKPLGIKFQDIAYIFVTHFHPDHLGLARELKRLSGARVILHRREDPRSFARINPFSEEALRWGERNGMPHEEIEQLRAQTHDHGPFHLEPDIAVDDGETIALDKRSFQVFWTPGHSPGHICLYEPATGIFFSGDHILPVITPNISLFPLFNENPLEEYIDSLRKVENLKVSLCLPAHEFPFSNFKERVAQIKHHHEVRLQAMLQALGKGWKSAYQVAVNVPWDLGPWSQFGAWDRRSAVGETLAHLDFLLRERKVERQETEAQVLYRSLNPISY